NTIDQINKLTIIPGVNKNGKKELTNPLDFQIGEVIAIIGSTGSGKSQLLNDIEGLARGDSLSKRRILIDDHSFSEELYLNQTVKPVAHISQSMNYMIDLSVGDFLDIHCNSQNLEASNKLKKKVIATACTICEENFTISTNIINLSGGQSRALMIADALYISNSPVILVDEIENAGIDKQNALNLLIKEGNITFIATHDPLIALMAHKRIVMKNGGITKIIQRTIQEENTLNKLTFENNKINQLKAQLRNGEELGEY
ncbi:MAG: ATP-binding cassette domain-containing protein, partial [Bacteroidales bacterium]|nr:ATP-binding cassette domain-containing protein [Bacteroidales bacterium]